MLVVGVDSREAFAGVADDDCVAEENLILGCYVVEDGCDSWKANVQWVEWVFDEGPELQRQKELQVLVAPCEVPASKCNDVENRLANRIKHDVRFRVLVPAEVASPDVSVSPVAELREAVLYHVRRHEFRPSHEA